MDRTGQHRDAVPADLVAEVLTGHADCAAGGWFQDTPLQVVPLLSRDKRGDRRNSGNPRQASTPLLLIEDAKVMQRIL